MVYSRMLDPSPERAVSPRHALEVGETRPHNYLDPPDTRVYDTYMAATNQPRPALTASDIDFAAFVTVLEFSARAYAPTVASANAARHEAYTQGDRRPARRETQGRRNARLFFGN